MASTSSLRACCLQTEARSCHRTIRVRAEGRARMRAVSVCGRDMSGSCCTDRPGTCSRELASWDGCAMRPELTRSSHSHRSCKDRRDDAVLEVLQLVLLVPATSTSGKHVGIDEAHGGPASGTVAAGRSCKGASKNGGRTRIGRPIALEQGCFGRCTPSPWPLEVAIVLAESARRALEAGPEADGRLQPASTPSSGRTRLL